MKKGSLSVRILLGTGLLIAGSASPVYAADPTFTGITAGPAGPVTQVDPAIPAGYAELKASQLAAVESGQLSVAGLRAKKTGSGAGLVAQAHATPLTAICVNGYPCVWSFPDPGLHQMRTYYCVVAFVQSVAKWDLDGSYITMGTGSQLGGQDVIYGALGSNTVNIDVRGLSWINTQFRNRSYGFSYVAVKPTSAYTFMNYVRADVYAFAEMNYVRVNLGSGSYGKWVSGGLHATGSTGYNDTAGTATSYDPYALRNGDGTCAQPSSGHNPSYSSSQTLGCTWTMPQANYFFAMDTSGAGTNPVWY
jgi:hypothetical protein